MTIAEAKCNLRQARVDQRKTQEAANVAWTAYYIARADDIEANQRIFAAECELRAIEAGEGNEAR